MENELKPCPFCGSSHIVPAPLSDYQWYRCNDCDALSGHNGVDGWNNRPVEDALRAELATVTAERDDLRIELDKAVLLLITPRLAEARAELAAVTQERDRMREALEYYANQDYNGTGRGDDGVVARAALEGTK